MQDVTVMAGNGVDRYASIPTFSPVAFEYSAWVNREVFADTIRFFGNTANSNGRLAVLGSESYLYLDDSSGTRISTPADTLITGQDQYVQVQVLADGSAWIKVDGVVVATEAAGTFDGLGWGIDSIGRGGANYLGDSVTITNQVFKDLDTGLTRTYNNTDNYERLGSELIVNGDFDTDSDWTKGTGWTIAGGLATYGGGVGGDLDQTTSLVVGKTYKVTYTVSGITAGSVTAKFRGGTSVSGQVANANGTYTDIMVAVVGNISFAVLAGASFVGNIDNITVTEHTLVLPDSSDNYLAFGSELWVDSEASLGAGWSRNSPNNYSGVSVGSGKKVSISNSEVPEPGSTVVISFDVSNYVAGFVNLYALSGLKAAVTPLIGANGSYEFTLQMTTDTALTGNRVFAQSVGGTDFTGDVSNVSIKETTLVPQDYAGKNPSNLVTNGNFAYTTDWSYALNGGTASISNGKLTLVRADGNDASVNQVVTGFVIGQRYIVSLDVLSTVGSNKVSLFGGVLPYATTTGLRTVEVEATSTSATLNIQKGGLSGSHAVFNSISVKHVDDVTDGAWVNATLDDLVYLP
jgi:hypothetical protein